MGSFGMKIGGAGGSLRSLCISASSGGNEKTGPLIMEVPLDKIRRPLMRTRANDPIKVQHLMDSIQQIGLQVPDSQAVTGTKHTSGLVSQLSAAKFVAEQKKHSGIIFDKFALYTG